jgi:CHAT domain-containing protein
MKRALFVLLVLSVQTFAQKNSTIASIDNLYKRAQGLFARQQYEKALTASFQAAQQFEHNGQCKNAMQCYNLISEIYQTTAKYDSAIFYARKVLQGCKNIPAEKETADAYINIGNVLLFKPDYTAALENFTNAYRLQQRFLKEDDPAFGKTYHGIRMVYYNLGNLDLAYEYDQRSLAIYQSAYGMNSKYTAIVFYDIGTYHILKGNFEQGLTYFKKALNGFLHQPKKDQDPLKLAACYNGIGVSYRELHDYPQAQINHTKALAIYLNTVGSRHPYTAMYYRNIGDDYRLMKNYTMAMENYKKALPIVQGVFGSKHPGISIMYQSMSDVFEAEGKYEDALAYTHKALMAVMSTFHNEDVNVNPKIENYLDPNEALHFLTRKAERFKGVYRSNKVMDNLIKSLSTYQSADTLIEQIRQSYLGSEDKIQLGQKAIKTYEGAIDAAFQLYEITKRDQFYKIAFDFSEKSKARVLKEGLFDVASKNLSILPEGFVKFEEDLKQKQSTLRSQIIELQLRSGDTLQIQQANKNLFAVNRSIDSLSLEIKNKYNTYFKLKYSDATMSYVDLQRSLDPNTAFIEYFYGQSGIFVFSLTKTAHNFLFIANDSLQENVQRLLRSLQPAAGDENHAIRLQNFIRYANILFQEYLKPVLPGKISKLVVVPDGPLTNIPFDVLLTTLPDAHISSYKDLPYVIRDCAVTYCYSATLFNEMKTEGSSSGKGYIAFAPVYNANAQFAKMDKNENVSRLKTLTPLKWNKKEVQGIQRYLDGVAYTDDVATETRFKNEVSKYAIVHLAMHTILKEDSPMYSCMIFSPEKNSTNSLNTFELYNMSLPVDMVVLSGCETGQGKFVAGEGILSLGRAFTFAGSRSVVMSHWAVDDEATAKVMELFYRFLSEGYEKDEALQKAKLKYLSDQHPARQDPAFWASFVLFGSNAPIDNTSYISLQDKILVFIVTLFLIAGMTLFISRKR